MENGFHILDYSFFTSSWDKQSVCWLLIALVCKLYGIFYQATTIWFIYLVVYNYFVFLWVGSRTHHVVWWAFEMPYAWKKTSFSTQGSYRLDLFFDNVSIYILQNGNELVKFQLVYMLFPLYILFCWCTSKWVFLMKLPWKIGLFFNLCGWNALVSTEFLECSLTMSRQAWKNCQK